MSCESFAVIIKRAGRIRNETGLMLGSGAELPTLGDFYNFSIKITQF